MKSPASPGSRRQQKHPSPKTDSADVKGHLCLVLHAHLPFVRHPEHEYFLEEDWLFEAISETYLPLLILMDEWDQDDLKYQLTLSFTPSLCNMLADPMLQSRYQRHLDNLEVLIRKEKERTADNSELHSLACFYESHFKKISHYYKTVLQGDIISGFRRHAENGNLSLITSAATHAFFPLLQVCPEAVRAQIEVAVQEFNRLFGFPPKGFWLPECGYFPGVEWLLEDAGFEYFFMDAHGLLYGKPCPTFGVYAPGQLKGGIKVFPRDPVTAKVVWSALEGYPGDGAYREFHRDIGYDLAEENLQPVLDPGAPRKFTGIKYHRITDRGRPFKHLYNPQMAKERAQGHASHFLAERVNQSIRFFDHFHKKPLIVSPYDAELFGHWWFEGLWWLDAMVREMATGRHPISWITPESYLADNPIQQTLSPIESSWGEKGFHEYWLNETNDWIYPHVHEASFQMVQFAREYKQPSPLIRRTLNQAAREILLAEGSDWAFIMRSGTSVEYAVRRLKIHLGCFKQLAGMLLSNSIDEEWLADIEMRHNCFPDINFRIFA